MLALADAVADAFEAAQVDSSSDHPDAVAAREAHAAKAASAENVSLVGGLSATVVDRQKFVDAVRQSTLDAVGNMVDACEAAAQSQVSLKCVLGRCRPPCRLGK